MISVPVYTLRSSCPDPALARAIDNGLILQVYSNGFSSLVCVTTVVLDPDLDRLQSFYVEYTSNHKRLKNNSFFTSEFEFENGVVLNSVKKRLTREVWYTMLNKHKDSWKATTPSGMWPCPLKRWDQLSLESQEEVLRGFR